MNTETVKLADLKHPEINPRKHPAKQLNEFMRSIEKYGQYRPFVIDENNVVYVGNGMLDAMVQLGMTEGQAYRFTGMTAEEKNKLMLSDNKIYDLGIDFMSSVDELMATFSDFDIPGFDADILEGIYGDSEDFAEDEIMSYGQIPQEAIEEKQRIEQKHEKIIQEDPIKCEASSQNFQPISETAHQQTAKINKSITCPHCGKDSIVLLDLIYKLIQKGEINADQLNVFFMDEEAMFDDVINITMKWRKRILAVGAKFLWFCMEYKHFNCLNTLSEDETFICWDRYKKDVWVRPMPKFAITHHPLFKPRIDNYQAFCIRVFAQGVNIQGLRTAESLQRRQFINRIAKKRETKGNTPIYPIYDWKDGDVWKYIKDNGLEIPDTYQYLWEIGTRKNMLRISQFFSVDTARVLSKLNEFYPDLMERVCKREPNAYLVSLYMDTEMFRNNTKKRKELEAEDDEKDYKSIVINMLNHPNDYRLGVNKSVFMDYKRLVLDHCPYIADKFWKKIHAALISGDPKRRTLRSVSMEARSHYDSSNIA